jgi:hypothetical protein
MAAKAIAAFMKFSFDMRIIRCPLQSARYSCVASTSRTRRFSTAHTVGIEALQMTVEEADDARR